MKTVLFTGGGGAATGALNDLLRDRYLVHFADADPQARPPFLPSSRWHQIPPAKTPQGLTPPDFILELIALCQHLHVDLLVPGVDEELRPIAWRRAEFPCPVLLPDFTFIARHLDKYASMRALASHGISVPCTDRLVRSKTDPRHWPAFPCVLKPREGRGSRHVRVITSVAEGDAHLRLAGLPPVDFITQEYLEGQEYTVTVVADASSRIQAIVPARVDLKRGVTVRAETAAEPDVIGLCLRIHAADPWSGCINVQCIHVGPGDVRPFEINPRVSTTTCLAIAAGVDPILIFDREGQSCSGWANGLRLHRTWRTEFQ